MRMLTIGILTMVLLTGCASQSAPAVTPATQTQPAPSTMPAPAAATAQTRPSATPEVAAAPPRFPSPVPGKYATDASGRVLGGNQPIINYAPDMVTGKPCPRVTQWQARALEQMSGPAGDYFVASDPCVVQNAIDDFVQIAWAIPWYNDREQMLALEELYLTDPVLKKGIDPEYFKRALEGKKYQEVWIGYRVCEPPLLSLITANAQSKMDRTGKVIEIGVVDVTQDFAPSTCRTVMFDSGRIRSQTEVLTEEKKAEGFNIFAFWMFWSEPENQWRFGGLANPYGKLDLKQVQQLYDTARNRP